MFYVFLKVPKDLNTSACPHSIYLFCELSDKDGYFSTIEDNYNENRGCPLCDLFIPKGKLLKHIEQKHFQFGVECVVRDKAGLYVPFIFFIFMFTFILLTCRKAIDALYIG